MREKIVKKDFYQILPLEEIRHSLRISGTYEDSLLQGMIAGIICFAEGFLDMEIQKKQILLTGKHTGKIFLKRPLIEVNSVKSEGFSANYTLYDFLQIDVPFQRNIEILYTCGFGEDEMPTDLKMAMRLHIAFLYDSKGERGSLPRHILEIYSKYKIIKF